MPPRDRYQHTNSYVTKMQHDCFAARKEPSSDEEDVTVLSESPSGGSSATLLSVLDDKNRAIETLQRQLTNQKVQLAFYIKKALNDSAIQQLSKTCDSEVIDGNIPLTLAVTNFYRQTGKKSALMALHERMTNIDERIQSVVARQERILRNVLEKIAEPAQPSGLCVTRDHFSMLNELFDATLRLQSELDRYRLYCNRLIDVEDERNSLVEQVYSLPVEERVRCNDVLMMQIEKQRLEKEIHGIRHEQRELRLKLHQLKILERGLIDAQTNGGPSDGFGNQLIDMLESVKSDAVALLSISNNQKFRYNNELSKLALQNQALEKELEQVRQNGIREKDRVVQDLTSQLRTASLERDSLQRTVRDMKSTIEELENLRSNLEDAESLKRERDNYKSQVEDLEAIRRAYSQLVEHHPSAEELAAKEKKIEDLEAQREQWAIEFTKMKETTALQEAQVKQLLLIIEKLAESKDEVEVETTPKTERGSQYEESDSQIVPYSPRKLLHRHSYLLDEPPRAPPPTLQVMPCIVRSHVTQNFLETDNLQTQDSLTKAEENKEAPESLQLQNSCGVATTESLGGVTAKAQEKPPLSTTTLEVQRTNRQGKVETMKAVLESTSSLQGVIHLENANNLSLEVKCKKHKRNTGSESLDEYELMKDCSEETIPNICATYRRYQKEERLKNYTLGKCEQIDFVEVRKKETYELLNVDSEDLDVIEYKKAPSAGGRSSSSEDSSTSAEPFRCEAAVQGPSSRSEDHLRGQGEAKRAVRREGGNHQLVTIDRGLKSIAASLDSVLRKPGGKMSVINTLHEMYKSVFLQKKS